MRAGILIVAALNMTALAAGPVALIDPAKAAGGWTFDNGREFPGATGGLCVSKQTFRGKPVLDLSGDFTKGGNYVQAWAPLPATKLEAISCWLKAPRDTQNTPIRYTDNHDRVHQIVLRIRPEGQWQRVVVPLERFFKAMGTADAPEVVVKYESWDGAADRKKHSKPHQPAPNFAILASRRMGSTPTVLFADVQAQPSPETTVAYVARLDEALQAGETDWELNLGWEFRGAKATLDVVRDVPQAGEFAMRLRADFTAGGAYVGLRKRLADLDVQAVKAIRLRLCSRNAKSFGVRLVDETGQCHQRRGIPLKADGRWHDLALIPTEIAGGEHWGGANDGKWSGTVRLIELMLNTASSDEKKPELLISDIRADALVRAKLRPAAFVEDFEDEKAFRHRWKTAGDVVIVGPGFDGTASALALRRTLERLNVETGATSPTFRVEAGTWQVRCSWKA